MKKQNAAVDATAPAKTMSRKEREEIKAIVKEHEERRMRELIEAQQLIENTPAGRLLKEGKKFLVVPINEPHFPQVYRMIRQHEKKKGTWSTSNEENFNSSMAAWFATA